MQKSPASAVAIFSLLVMAGCSTGTVTVKATRWAGFVDRAPVKIYLMNITGESSEEFRKELTDELTVNRRFLVQPYGTEPPPMSQDSMAEPALVLSGLHETRTESRTESVNNGEKTKDYKVITDIDEFHYRVWDAKLGTELATGTVAHHDMSKEEKKNTSFLESVLDGIVKGVGETLLGIKSARRGHTIRELVASLLVHQEHMTLELYKDGDLPELKEGTAFAEKGNWPEAIKRFQASAEAHPTHGNVYKAYYNLGVAYEFNLEFDKALAALEASFELVKEKNAEDEIAFCRQFAVETAWREQFFRQK